MATAGGPDIITDGLVFGYDADDRSSRFYPGEPAVNSVPDASGMVGWSSYSNGNDGTFITEFGTTGYKIINKLSWNGLFKDVVLPATGVYTFSAWYRYWGSTGSNNGSTVYISGYGGGDASTSLDKTKVGVWQKVSHTVSVTDVSLRYYIISFGGSGSTDRSTWDVTKPQIELNSHATQFTSTSRSATQALIDLKKATTIDVSNVSFDSTAHPIFDGTDDSLYPNIISNGSGLTDITAEFVVKASANNKNILNSSAAAALLHYGGAGFYLVSTDGTASGYLGWNGKLSGGGTGSYEHLVATYDGTTMRLYVNGESTGTTRAYSAGATGVLKDLNGVRIGGNFNSTQPWFNGNIPIAKIYNQALTAEEITQNFNAYKNRFNI